MARKKLRPSALTYSLNFLREYGSFLKASFMKIPSFIWGTFAVIGILVVGMVLGMSIEESIQDEQEAMVRISRENTALWRLVDRYDELSHLYFLQGENFRVILDPDVFYNYPDQTYEATLSLRQYQDLIIEKQKEIEEARSAAWDQMYHDKKL